VATADRVGPAEMGKLFHFDPEKGVWVTSLGPQGSGKSDFCLRIFEGYPYDGLLIDNNADADPQHNFTVDLPSPTPTEWPEPDADGAPFRHYRYVPPLLDDDWLEQTDDVVGLCYRRGLCCILFDEAADDLPANNTRKWGRLTLGQGRHRKLSLLFATPRPAVVNPLTLSQAHLVTIHGQLHDLDINRVARHLHLKDWELIRLCEALDVDQHEFLAYNRLRRELMHCDGLPPRRHAPAA
jgi:hypothetical protein